MTALPPRSPSSAHRAGKNSRGNMFGLPRRSLYASSARIAALLKHLEAKGWIVRTPDAADVRRVDVVLTEAGAACIRERLGAVLDEVSVLLSALSPEEAAEYVRLQRKLLEKGGTV